MCNSRAKAVIADNTAIDDVGSSCEFFGHEHGLIDELGDLQTGIAATMGEHPVDLLKNLGFNITVNCDNRLMSRTTMSREFALLSEAFGWTLADVERCTLAAMRAAFLPLPEREALINDVILPAYATAR